jgi:hypothetical protein
MKERISRLGEDAGAEKRLQNWSGSLKSSGLTQRKFSENRGIALSVLQRSLKIERRVNQPKLMAVQIAADEPTNRALELMVGEDYRIKIGSRFCAATLRRLLEVLGSC